MEARQSLLQETWGSGPGVQLVLPSHPLSLAGELLTGSPGADHCPCPLVAVLVLKLQPALPVGCTGSPGEETRTSEGAGSLVLHRLMPQPRPSPQPQTTWGGVGWCQAFQVKLFFMAR